MLLTHTHTHTRTRTRTHARTRTRTHAHARTHTHTRARTRTHTHTFNGPLSGTTRVSRYQKGKTNLGFTEATDSDWQWHQLGHMQVCTLLQTDNHASTPPRSFLQARCPSCHPTNSVNMFVFFVFYEKQSYILHFTMYQNMSTIKSAVPMGDVDCH